MKRRPFKLPHTLVLIYVIVLFVYFLSLIIPSGRYQRAEKSFQGQTKLLTVPGTYEKIEKRYLGPEWLLISPIRGFEAGVLIIVLIFIFGGVFAVFQKTGAIEAGIRKLSHFFSRKPAFKLLVIPVLMIVFSLAGGVYGMAEEAIPFTLIFIPFALSLGYDSYVGVSIPFLGSAIGFSAAFFNPFTVGIAQMFSDLPLYSGLSYRMILWVIGTIIVIGYVMVYAEKVRKKPELSPVYELDKSRGYSIPSEMPQKIEWGTAQKSVLWIILLGILLLVFGILFLDWYMEEIAALFLGMGILSGFVGKIPVSEMAKTFVDGAKDVMNVVLIIAIGRAVLIILQESFILDTILHSTASVISVVPGIVTAHMMFVVQAVINFFIHSGTAQAALTMPVMAPLSDLVGISRQTTVLAFQLCEVINPILPTSAVTMGVLGVAKIPWEKWAKWFLPLMLILIVFSLLALVPPVLMNWGPF